MRFAEGQVSQGIANSLAPVPEKDITAFELSFDKHSLIGTEEQTDWKEVAEQQ